MVRQVVLLPDCVARWRGDCAGTRAHDCGTRPLYRRVV